LALDIVLPRSRKPTRTAHAAWPPLRSWACAEHRSRQAREGKRSPIAWYPCREGARFGPEVASFASRRGDHRPLEAAMQATPIEELRKPHPDQQRIDSLSAQILRATALEVLRRKQPEVRTGLPVPAVGLSRRQIEA